MKNYLSKNIVTITVDHNIATAFLRDDNFLKNHNFGNRSAIGRISITNTTEYQLIRNNNEDILWCHINHDLCNMLFSIQ